MKKLFFASIGSLTFLAPTLAFAQISTLTNTVGQTEGLVTTANTVLNYIIGLLITVAVIVFIFYTIKFIISKDAESQKAAKSYMLYGILAIAVIIGIFGLARFLLSTFGIGTGGLNSSEQPVVQ